MSIVGRLEDVPVVDVLSMLHLSGRSGALTLESDAGTARIVFRMGAIVTASCPALGRSLGTVLTERRGIAPHVIDGALALQRERRRPLGHILLELGVVDRAALHDAVTALIREVVAQVLRWRAGSFCFEVCATPVADEVAVVPEEVALDAGLAVRELLSDAMRLFGEHAERRTREMSIVPPRAVPNAAPTPEEASPASHVTRASVEPEATQRMVVLVTDDGIVANTLRATWSEDGVQSRCFPLEQEAARQVAELLGAGADVVTVLHAEGLGQRNDPRGIVASARRLKAAFPRMPIVVLGSIDGEARHELLRHGVRATVSLCARHGDPKAFRAALGQASVELRAILTGAFVELAGSESFVNGATRDLKRLAARVEGLHRSTEHTAVALALLDYVAENVERAVFFLCRRQDMIAVSAFGLTNTGDEMVRVTPGLGIRFDEAPVLRAVVEEGRSMRGCVSSEPFECSALAGRIGKPKSGAALWIPVRSLERVFAVLYADNGARSRPLVSTEALDVLACQAGLMLENMALKRRASRVPDVKVKAVARG